MSNCPLISVVVPTRNRAHLLRYALQSALEQTFNDYEVVISNNSSDDDTEKVVLEHADTRIRYFKTEKILPMPDSWEFALRKTRGQWITFLCDDDAISPMLLERISHVIAKSKYQLVGWARACYFHPTWYDPRWRNRLLIRRFTGKVIEYDSGTQLANLFAFRWVAGLPRMLDSCCHRDIIDKITRLAGRFFQPPAPDFSSSALMLGMTRKYAYLDVPLALSGEAPESTGRSTASSLAFVQEFDGEVYYRHVPLQTLVTHNGIAESLLRAKEAMPTHLSHVELDWLEYFACCSGEVLALAPWGISPSPGDKEELFATLRKRPRTFRARVCVRTMRRWIDARLRKLVLSSPKLTSLAFWILGRRVLSGEEGSFTNAAEAVRHLSLR